jgi:hypothetical protein
VREAELLRLGVAEVEGVAPTSGEDTALPPRSSGSPTPTTCGAAATAQVALTGDEDAPDGTDALQLLVAPGARCSRPPTTTPSSLGSRCGSPSWPTSRPTSRATSRPTSRPSTPTRRDWAARRSGCPP